MLGTDTCLSESQALGALEHWRLPAPVERIEPGSGTANAAAIVRAGGRAFVLKRRNPRYAVEQWVAFDHALMAHLRARGIPVPLPLPARDRRTWLHLDGAIFELSEFIPGDEHRWGDASQVRAAGEMLARFHLAGEDFRPPAEKSWDRYHSPGAITSGLRTARIEQYAVFPEPYAAVRAAERIASRLLIRLPDAEYWALPLAIVHGDWHPANLKFAGDRVVGVFDLDWCTSQPRVVDLADGLLFFCGHRAEPIVPGDIWSLTQSFEMDAGLVGAFGEGYLAHIHPTPAELQALPDLMRARWLFCRVDAADRKVEPARWLEFIARGLLKPLEWIQENEGAIADGSLLHA